MAICGSTMLSLRSAPLRVKAEVEVCASAGPSRSIRSLAGQSFRLQPSFFEGAALKSRDSLLALSPREKRVDANSRKACSVVASSGQPESEAPKPKQGLDLLLKLVCLSSTGVLP